MAPELCDTLALLRARRGFRAPLYVRAKAELLNAYLRDSGVAACVVGVSGGVDSAVTLGLVAAAARADGSPIRRVVAALVPIFGEGATHQHDALARGREVAAACGAEVMELDLSGPTAALRQAVERGAGVTGSAWAAGQLVSYARTPALYYAATLLTDGGCPAVVVGTTNRDEGGYIGFFGKASDGMVDIQLISDVHKREVYALAELLEVPASVRAAVPAGDVFDGRTDEEMIGTSYAFVELVGLYLSLASDAERARIRAGWSAAAREQFDAAAAILDALHRKNRHKYLGSSPAIHLDVLERPVPAPWAAPVPASVPPEEVRRRFVGAFELDRAVVEGFADASRTRPVSAPLLDFGGDAFLVHDLLSQAECTALLEALERQPRVPVGRDGRREGHDPARDPIGSHRASVYDEALACALWDRLAAVIPNPWILDELSPTDGGDHRVWRAIGLNPLFRFIRYEPGGQLVAHHDAGHDFGDDRRHTLMSVVIALTDGGETRLLLDRQRHLPTSLRCFADREDVAPPRDVLLAVPSQAGRALVFAHRIPHDAPTWPGPGARVVLRTDVVYTRCGHPGAAAPARPPVAARSDESPRLLAKILQDSHYSSAYRILGSAEAMVEAGFFDDGAPIDGDRDERRAPEWMVTPLHKITARLDGARDHDRWLAVLVSTGGFWPVHEGHLEMMELAREELERRGSTVLGGYLSLEHDDYVRSKCGPDVPGAAHRIRLAEQAIEASPWLMVDPWQALHADRPLNFSDVIARLETYLSAHVRTARPIRVVYVFGGDNARFTLAFVGRGRSICVPRPGHDQPFARIAGHPLVQAHADRLILAGARSAPDAASTRIRGGDERGLPGAVRGLWSTWRSPTDRPRRAVLHLRDEGDWAVAPWLAGRDADVVRRAYAGFARGLLAVVREAFTTPRPPDGPLELRIEVLRLEQQRARAAALREEGRVLSLDPCLEGHINLGVSRCFELAVSEARPGIVARPGWPALDEQIGAVPPGEYLLLDDDIATGRTIESVRSLLGPTRVIRRVVALCDFRRLPGADDAALTDLFDCRDFLVGAREAGLVVALPDGTRARAPYALPYVRLARRVSAPLSRELALSRAIWRLNLEFFARVDPPLRVADAAPAFRVLSAYLGFDARTTLLDVCRWHARRLGA